MTLLEVCLESARAARFAKEGGAQRVELCADLFVGGVTPDVGLLREVRAACDLPIMSMVRPRPGEFVYTDDELKKMEATIEHAVENGADGVVVGALERDGSIDARAVERLVRAAGSHPVTFHRAFDQTPDPWTSADLLVELGVERVLTSGHATTALEGAERLAALVAHVGSSLVVMPGGNIRSSNVADIIACTGAREVHSSVGGEAAISAAAVRELASRLRGTPSCPGPDPTT